MIKPNDLKNIEIENTNFEELETKIDNGIKSSHGLYPWETAIIEGEYSLESRNMIARKYKEKWMEFCLSSDFIRKWRKSRINLLYALYQRIRQQIYKELSQSVITLKDEKHITTWNQNS